MAKQYTRVSAKDVSSYLYSNYGVTLAQAKALGKQSIKRQKAGGGARIEAGSGAKAPGVFTSGMRPAGASGKAERGRTTTRIAKKKK